MRYRRNAVKCLVCEKVIESEHLHDFKWCGCKYPDGVFVDGGEYYLRRGGNTPYEDLSEVAEDEEWKE